MSYTRRYAWRWFWIVFHKDDDDDDDDDGNDDDADDDGDDDDSGGDVIICIFTCAVLSPKCRKLLHSSSLQEGNLKEGKTF